MIVSISSTTDGCKPFGRLVEQQQFRLLHQRAGDGQLLLLAAGEDAALASDERLEGGKVVEDEIAARRRSHALAEQRQLMFSATVRSGMIWRPCGT